MSALQHTLCCPLPSSIHGPSAQLQLLLWHCPQGDDLAFTTSLFSLCGTQKTPLNASVFWSQLPPALSPRAPLHLGHWQPHKGGQQPAPLRRGPLRTGPLSGLIPSQDRSPLRTGPLSEMIPSQDRSPLRTGPLSGEVPSGLILSQDWVPSQDWSTLRTGPLSGHMRSGLGPFSGLGLLSE